MVGEVRSRTVWSVRGRAVGHLFMPVRTVTKAEVLSEGEHAYRLHFSCDHSVLMRWRKGHLAEDLPPKVRKTYPAARVEWAWKGQRYVCPVCDGTPPPIDTEDGGTGR